MKKERIKIATNSEGLNKLNESIDHVTGVLVELSEFMKENLSLELTKDLALDVLSKGGIQAITMFRDDQSKKLEASGMTGRVKERLLKVAEGDLASELFEFKDRLHREGLNKYNAIDAMNYISIDKGLPLVSKKDKEAMLERFTVFAETEAHFELHAAHKEAVDALNNLREVVRKHQPRAFFISPIQFYSTFFKMEHESEVFIPEVINYKAL